MLFRKKWPPLWSSGQSFLLKIQRSGFGSRRYHNFRKVVGLERGPLSLMNTIQELLERKSRGSGLEHQNYRRGSATLSSDIPLPEKFGINFSDKRRSLGRHSSLVDSGHGVCCLCVRWQCERVISWDVTNECIKHPLPHSSSWHSAYLVKHWDNFTFSQGRNSWCNLWTSYHVCLRIKRSL
jgi:hypothetical protein